MNKNVESICEHCKAYKECPLSDYYVKPKQKTYKEIKTSCKKEIWEKYNI